MGDIADCEIDVDAKTSPHHVAIDQAQEKLRQEYDVREQRRRELEFLEKGGNPLDYKSSHVTPLGVQSTSQKDQLADQNVISEAKGSFALVASPPGDSVESSGRCGGSVSHEPNTADNILLLDVDSICLRAERNVKRSGKRSNLSHLQQSSLNDCSHGAKELDDTAVLCLGTKGQAYARRNRLRSSHDGSNVGSDIGLRHDTRSSLLRSSCPDLKEAKGSVQEAWAEKHVASYVSNSKPTNRVNNAVSNTAPCDDQLAMELDGMLNDHGAADTIKGHAQIAIEDKSSETMPAIAINGKQFHIPAENITEAAIFKESDISGKDVPSGLHTSHAECNEDIKDESFADKVNLCRAEKSVINLHDDPLSGKTVIPETATNTTSASNKEPDSSANMVSSNKGYADGNESRVLRKAENNFDVGLKDQTIRATTTSDTDGLKENGLLKSVDEPISCHDVNTSSNISNSVQIKDEVEMCDSVNDPENILRQFASTDFRKVNNERILEAEKKLDGSVGESSSSHKAGLVKRVYVSPTSAVSATVPSVGNFTSNPELQVSGGDELKLVKKECESSILRKARIIEASLKKASKLSSSNVSVENRQKCHWNFVLEEMAWMANDFMQERLWKVTAAARVCHSIASDGRAKFELANMQRKQKKVARTLAKAIMHFWHSAEVLRTTGEAPKLTHECNSDMLSLKSKGAEAEREQDKKSVEENSGKACQLAIQNYAVRILEYIHSVSDQPVSAEAPSTPDRLYDVGILEVSDQLSEESIFYTVCPGAMQAYRDSVESQWLHYKKMANNVCQEDCETSMCGPVADGPQENAYEEDEGETCTYLLPGTYEGGLTLQFSQKRRKTLRQKTYAGRVYDVVGDISYEPCLESKSGNQSVLNGKRSSGSLDAVTIPRKCVHTASRQCIVSPFGAGIPGAMQVTSKTDVSSGDTNSYQEDESLLYGVSLPKKNTEVESTVDFERQYLYDGSEVSMKAKKKKKPKHLGYKNSLNLTNPSAMMVSGKGPIHEQRSQIDAILKHEPKEYLKKRLESQQFASSGNTVVYGQHATKNPKLLKQVPDISQEVLTPFTGPMISPIASQMSNMSNSNKHTRIITIKDRGRKSKALKLAAGHSGSGSPWSNFEDQALVVLVHDMGPNWDLVSDAINSTLQFKCIFRKPKECKERHKFLMDRSAGDGADSAEDSGSPQPYPSTLPGIPKGSARQLFQRLQGPLEEDTLKAHFEKIILLGQQLHSHRSQNNCQELKQITPAHGSHVVALTQACPNNLVGGILMPLDLCDATTSNTDVLPVGYEVPHTNGLALLNYQGSVAPVLPTSNSGSLLQGSPGNFPGSNLPPSSALMNSPARDAQRYNVSRAALPQNDEQQRIQQYNQMLSGRNLQQPGISVVPGSLPIGVDRVVHMIPGAHGMGMMCGLNRNMAMPRPGFQRLTSPGMLNMIVTGSMMSVSGQGMQNGVNVHPGAISGPGNSVLRPHDPLQIIQPSQNLDEHRQTVMQELQIHVSQGNGQAVHFSGIRAQCSSAATSAPAQTFMAQQSQPAHQMPQQPQHMFANPHNSHIQGANLSSSQQQAGAIAFAKERQMQQRMAPPLQPPFSGPNSLSPIYGSQIQQQTQSSLVTSVSASQSQHKQQHTPQNPPDRLPNQIMKQKQRQAQQPPRQNEQQKQQSHQLTKHTKNLGRGSILMHQNLPFDASQVSSYSTASKNQVSDKNLMQQGQGLFPVGSGLNSSLPQPGNEAKAYSSSLQQSAEMPIAPSHCVNSNQGTTQGSSSPALLASQQSPIPSSLHLSSQQQRCVNPSQQTTQRVAIQQTRTINSDGRLGSNTGYIQLGQMIPPTTIPKRAESSSLGVSSSNHWKPEPSYDTSAIAPTAQLASLPQEAVVGNEMLQPSSGQGLVQRQISGGSVHGHGIGGQRQQTQHNDRPMVQGKVYAQPSNSGPG